MKRRVEKKVERRMLVDVLCEKQRRIDEYERFIGDLLIMLHKKEPQCVIKHGYPDQRVSEMGFIWDEVLKLLKKEEKYEGTV